MLDVRKLLMLRAVAAEGSIAAAGRALRYTRSAVSQQLSALETEAGTALVDRRGNRITLTPAGRILLEHTERILVELRAAEATLSRDDQAVSGLLRVGVAVGRECASQRSASSAAMQPMPAAVTAWR